MKVVILAGGLGTRLSEETNVRPKPMANYFPHNSNVTFDLRGPAMGVQDGEVEPWRVTLVDTGSDTQTGGRVKRVAEHLGNETFLLTYGDGVADVDVSALLAYHRAHGRLATVTAVQPLGRFGALELDDGQRVTSFTEKPAGDGAWVNGGFFVLEPGALDYIAGDDTYFEREPLERLAHDGELMAYRHRGFWQPMDVMRDKNHLEQLWQSGAAPWRVW